MRTLILFCLLSVGYLTSGFAQSSADSSIYLTVEQMPEFPGGDEAMFKFVQDNVKYPQAAAAKGIQGTVFVDFVVNRDGNVADVKLRRGVEPTIDAEALRVVSLMPTYKPGFMNGKAQRVQFTIPIKFNLVEGEKPAKKSKW